MVRRAYAEGAQTATDKTSGSFFPEIRPYHEEMVKVSDVHTIYYAVYGNPNGKPVLFIHGGPGGGTDPAMARYFDPAVYKIVLVDQRGCGKSTPFANLEDNTTYDLIRDFELIREKLGIKKWQLFGGSWGSCLSLAYAIEHPDRVTELVLRGIFLLREKELNWFYEGKGANYVFPEEWDLYESAIPPEERSSFIQAYGKRLRGELGEDG
jgi:proline iminopeptidase